MVRQYIASLIFFGLGAFFLAHDLMHDMSHGAKFLGLSEMTYMWIAMGAVHLLVKPCYCRNCNNG